MEPSLVIGHYHHDRRGTPAVMVLHHRLASIIKPTFQSARKCLRCGSRYGQHIAYIMLLNGTGPLMLLSLLHLSRLWIGGV
jgi:hypothetical protein